MKPHGLKTFRVFYWYVDEAKTHMGRYANICTIGQKWATKMAFFTCQYLSKNYVFYLFIYVMDKLKRYGQAPQL